MSALAAILERENALVLRFIDVLQAEQTALSSAQTGALEAINTEKLALVEALNLVGQERGSLINKDDSNPSQAQMSEWFASNSGEEKAGQLWASLMELAREARRLHELNGKLLDVMMRRTTEALDILTYRQQDVPLYGSDGQTASASGSRIVDSA